MATSQITRKELKYRKLYARALSLQIAPVLRVARDQGAAAAMGQIDLLVHADPLANTYRQMLRDVGAAESYRYRNMLLRRKEVEPGWLDYFDQFIMPVMWERTAKKVTRITSNTREILRGTIQNGINEGWGIDKIARELRDMVSTRARTIAQTEVISASNQAAYAGAESAGIRYKKFWSTSGLQGIRPSHIQAEADSYAMDGIDPHAKFSNGLMHPGDPEGPADEVVNCRCSLIVIPV